MNARKVRLRDAIKACVPLPVWRLVKGVLMTALQQLLKMFDLVAVKKK